MKRYIILGALLVSAITSHADLHDTYELSCQRFQSKGYIDQKTHSIMWTQPKYVALECFVDNECVAMVLAPIKGLYYTITDVVDNILPISKGPTQNWSRIYYDTANSVAAWATDDDLIRAQLFSDGTVRVCYKWWLEKKGLIDNPPAAAEKAPIEDVEDGAATPPGHHELGEHGFPVPGQKM
jgi:hypothetical protein